ncbi:hypothetical protein AJ80_02285 [Polytolypa hystricis UAMH7299]|uniref:F-box domain-containing protein n=1 Tax=Polytolypa hystricis (strain UAMH7299) TaxID=1447883 RepID=A0A2B7YRK8_POLH7|nr:hypothetical protein AJ80_02285 [Polytolypa hystricis UAMH7299]
MSGLPTLPTETLLEITKLISPDDIVSWSLSCKRIFSCAQARLKEHRELRAKYRSVNTNHHPSTLLCEIWANPRIGYYIRTLAHDGLYHGKRRDDFQLPEGFDGGLEILRSSPYLQFNPSLIDSFNKAVTSYGFSINPPTPPCAEGACAALLLSLLPNLTRLRLQWYDDIEEFWDSFLETIVKANDKDPSLPALRKLNILCFDHWDTRYSSCMSAIFPLLPVPSLRKLYLHAIDTSWDEPPEALTSSVEEICANDCTFPEGRAFALFPRLKKLTFINGGAMADGEMFWNVAAFINGLAKHTSETLEELSLDHQDPELELHFTDLSMFKKLKNFTSLCYLIVPAPFEYGLNGNEDEDVEPGAKAPNLARWVNEVPRLVDIFPRSIQQASLNTPVYEEYNDRMIKKLFDRFAEDKPSKCPDLVSIQLKGLEYPEPYFIFLLREMCKGVGVELKTYADSNHIDYTDDTDSNDSVSFVGSQR